MGLGPRTIRTLALGGTVVGGGFAVLMVFSAARVRALGGHGGLFSFEEVSLFETYNDGLAISITAIGVVSVIWAIREGYRGFSDLPGFSEAYEQATTDIDEAAEELVEDAIEGVEDISDDTLEEAEQALENATGGPEALKAKLLKQARRIEPHNDAVCAAKEAADKAARKKSGIAAFILGRKGQPAPPDLSAYDDLILPRIDDVIAELGNVGRADAAPIREAMHRLEMQTSSAIAEMRAALAAFRAEAPDLDALFDEEGDDDGTA